jgi:hypothetical protein
MKLLWLVCEGEYDIPVLRDVLTNVLVSGIIPKPSGGQKCAPSAASYLRKNDNNVIAAYVEDRDYRLRAASDASFSNGKPGFIWRRHAIESYLLEPAIIAQAFRSIQRDVAQSPSRGPAWVNALPTDEAQIANGLRACAVIRAPEEAMRMTIHRLWDDLATTTAQVQKRTPSIPGIPNPDAAACRSALALETDRLVQMAQQTVNSRFLEPSAVDARYDAELARIQAQSYMNNLLFLEDFHGRELIAVFREWLVREFKAAPSPKLLTNELVKAVPVVYQGNRLLYRTDDFLDLANGVRALAGLSALT